MKAIILTYDKRIELADLVISVYNNLIPNNKITEWLVPFNDTKPSFKSASFANVKFIKSGWHIKNTINSLLQGMDDSELIFWAFDDMYPVSIDGIFFNSICNFLDQNPNNQIDSIRLMSLYDKIVPHLSSNLSINNYLFHEKFTYTMFWFHQFIRVGLLKDIFIKNGLWDTYQIRNISEKYVPKHKCFIPFNRLASFGENSRWNFLTKNAFDKLKEYQINFPNINRFKETTIIDNYTLQGQQELRNVYDQYQKNKNTWYNNNK